MAIVAVKDFRREEKDPLDDMLGKISKGLQIAQSIYGIKTAMEQSDLRDLQMQAQEEKLRAETLKNNLAETGLLTPQQVMDSDIVTFRTKEDLAKAVGAQNWETAIKKYPALTGNIYEINVATPRREVTSETGNVIGVDDESRLLTKAPTIIRPQDLDDFEINVYKAAIKRGVLEQIQKGSVGGARTMKEFTEKWMPADDPEVLKNIPSQIAALREPVQVLENGQVVTRMGIRRSAVKPIQPTTSMDVAKLQAAQIGAQKSALDLLERQKKFEIEQDKKDRRQAGVYTPEEFYEDFIVIDDIDQFKEQSPSTAKFIPDNAFRTVDIYDPITGEMTKMTGVNRSLFDTALKQAKVNKQEGKADELTTNEKSVEQAWKKADATFAKKYTDYVAEGTEEKNFDEIRKLKETLIEAEKTLGDTWVDRAQGILPESIRDWVDPKDRSIEDRVKGQAQKTLRQLLGAQFTEKEGQMILDRSFNPRQTKEENIRRMKELLRSLEEQAIAQKKAMEYFSEKGTIKGFKAPKIDINIPGSDYVTVKKGDETLKIPRSRLKDAEADGYKLVK
jgi:hypothetical protein